jgi:exosome complex exonuclease RRP6
MEEKESSSRDGESVDLTADFKSYKDRVTASLLKATKQANAISAQDLSFHRNASENVSRALERQNAHLLRLTNKLLKAATGDTNVKAPQLKSRDAVDDNWPGVVDVVDNLLEKAASSLDEFNGLIKRQQSAPADRTPTQARPQNAPVPRFVQVKIEKPQLLFSRKVDNFATEPWKPLLTTKPHALVPLAESIGSPESG